MKNRLLIPALFFLIISFSSCTLISDIFKIGTWLVVLIVLVIIGLLVWIIAKFAD